MIPAGIERDKKIAELREDWTDHRWQDHPSGPVAGRVCGLCGIDYFSHDHHDEDKANCQKAIQPYSTDIAAAMELWQEMIEAGFKPVLRTIEIDHGVIGYRMIVGDKHGETYEGWAMADAISGAWLKWKESDG